MVGRLGQDELEQIAQGRPGRRWLLLEPLFSGMDESYTAAADELRERGFGVVVAHPERAAPGPATTAAIRHELRAGSILQLTAWSFAGEHGEQAQEIAWRWLRAAPGRVVIASDAHNLDRPPSLSSALARVAGRGVRDPGRLTGALPTALLEQGLATQPAVLAA
jgi:protein-tyrosine phosphatase